MKKVVIITENKYPREDAGAIRQHATAKIFQMLGFDVFVAGYGTPTGKGEKKFEGVHYRSFRPNSQNKLIRLIFRLTGIFRMMKYIRKHHSDASLFLVIDTFPYGFRMIESYARRKGIRLLHDSVEWYSPEEYADGEKNREYRLKEITNRKIVKGSWRVMAISTYLQEHFEKTCERAVRIPVMMDVSSILYRTAVDETAQKIRFVYAGGPGWKDYIREMIAGFSLLNEEERSKTELHFIGITKEQLISVCRADGSRADRASQSA